MKESTVDIVNGLDQDIESLVCTKCSKPVGKRSYLHQRFNGTRLKKDKIYHRECCGFKFRSQWKKYDIYAYKESLKNIPR